MKVITKEEGDELSKKRGCRFIESCKKWRLNIDQLYQDLLQQIMKKKKCKKKTKKKKKKWSLLKIFFPQKINLNKFFIFVKILISKKCIDLKKSQELALEFLVWVWGWLNKNKWLYVSFFILLLKNLWFFDAPV